MARKNPLGKVKDVAVETLKAPVTAAGSAVGLAKGAAAAGGQVTKSATSKAAGAMTSIVGGGKGTETASAPTEKAAPEATTEAPAAKKAPAEKPAAKKAPAEKPAAKKASTKKTAAKKTPSKKTAAKKAPAEPVNVTEELGLDPAPVDKPKRPKKTPAKPVTAIDAAADPAAVDVTPADVADQVGNDT